MRFGLVIYGSLETVSGGYLYDRQLVAALRRSGHEVKIISLPWRGYGLHLLDNLRRRLDHIDILLQDELNHPSLFWLNQRLTVPKVAIVHHLRISEQHPPALMPLYRTVESRYLNSVDAFIYNSETTRTTTEAHLNTRKPFVVAQPAGSRFEGLAREAIVARVGRGEALRVVFVGNLIARKGLDVLLKALVGSDMRLTVVGSTTIDPVYTAHIKHTIADLHLTDRVRLAGQLSDDELAAALASADVLAVPSSYEGFGIVYLEGMGFGLPAIGTTSGAAREIITHGQNGYLIESGAVSSLAAHLQTLGNREVLHKMSLNAYETFHQRPTWHDTTEKIERFLLELSEKI